MLVNLGAYGFIWELSQYFVLIILNGTKESTLFTGKIHYIVRECPIFQLYLQLVFPSPERLRTFTMDTQNYRRLDGIASSKASPLKYLIEWWDYS